MANQIEGVREKLIEVAIEEFLQKGYTDASLREIAKNAQTSTNSIYVRFGGKEELFAEIVNNAKQSLENRYKNALEDFDKNLSSVEYDKMTEYTHNKMCELIDLFYDNYKEFKLLVCCSNGTNFETFIDELAQLESDSTRRYFNNLVGEEMSAHSLSDELLHILSSAYWSGIFEIFYHDMDKENAKQYIFSLERFFSVGFEDILNKK